MSRDPYDVSPENLIKYANSLSTEARLERLERLMEEQYRDEGSRLHADMRAGKGMGDPETGPDPVEEAVAPTADDMARNLSRIATGVSIPSYFALQAWVDDPKKREKYLDMLAAGTALAHAPSVMLDAKGVASGEKNVSDTVNVDSAARALPLLEVLSRRMGS